MEKPIFVGNDRKSFKIIINTNLIKDVYKTKIKKYKKKFLDCNDRYS